MSEPYSFPALGTRWWIEIFEDVAENTLEEIYRSVHQRANDFDNNYSRFERDSLVTQLNTNRTHIAPSEEFLALLTYGQQLSERTKGTFNFLVGHILEARGYDADYTFDFQAESTLPKTNPQTDIQIAKAEVGLQNGNVDFGGFGKGYLIDILAEELKNFGVNYFLINGGGDLFVTSDNEKPITIHLEHPLNIGTSIGETTLKNEAFAASSPFKRQWTIQDKKFTHIVDDKNVEFASFVKAPSAADADAFATASLLLNQAELLELAHRENCEIARFSPETNSLWRTKEF